MEFKEKFITIPEARTILTRAHDKIKEYISTDIIDTVCGKSSTGRNFIFIKQEDVYKLKTKLNDSLNVKDAAKFLGISKDQFKSLVEEDVLKTIDPIYADFRSQTIVSKSEVEKIYKSYENILVRKKVKTMTVSRYNDWI